MPKVSIFKNVSQVTNPEDIDLITYLEQTRDGRWEDIVKDCRLIKDKKERDIFKQNMPTTTLSGTFSYRNEEGISKHSSIIAMDLDEIEDLQKLKKLLENDKYVYSVFMSTSGYGLRVLFKIVADKHREAFRGISQYLFDKYEVICDHNGVNISKPYVVSFDPGLYISFDDVPVFKKYVKEIVVKPLVDFVHTSGDFESVMKQIVGRGINICESYSDWLKVGFALSEQFGEDGRGYFHEISRFSAKYKSIITDKQYTSCLKARGQTNPVQISTFYYLAKINGVSITSEQTRTIVRTTRNGKKAGLKPEQIIANLDKFSNIKGADELVGKVFESNEEGDKEEESILFQLEMFIANTYNLKMNEVTGYLEQNEVPLSPSDLNSIFIASKKLIPKLDYQLLIRLLKSDFIESYNPFYKFFGSDGIAVILPAIPDKVQKPYDSPLIELLAATIKNEQPMFTSFFLRKWMVSAISAVHKVHSPLLLCLLGGQNTGKTEFFRRLVPKELMGYYAESKLDKEKDDELLMTENWIIMDDELGGKSKSDNLKLKNITSKQHFSLRRPYGDHNEKILRLAVLCGTSNYNEVLSDPTGNRRIIPIEVTDIDKNLYNSIDKKELWMEAFRLYKEGFDWRVTQNDLGFLNQDSVKYEQVVKERELIQRYFEAGDTEYMTSTDILVDIEILTRQKLNINIIGRELENMGYIRKSIREGYGKTPKKWGVTKINRTQELYRGQKEDDLPF